MASRADLRTSGLTRARAIHEIVLNAIMIVEFIVTRKRAGRVAIHTPLHRAKPFIYNTMSFIPAHQSCSADVLPKCTACTTRFARLFRINLVDDQPQPQTQAPIPTQPSARSRRCDSIVTMGRLRWPRVNRKDETEAEIGRRFWARNAPVNGFCVICPCAEEAR
ncbi:hypothetical protein C8R44DRAFT_882892 [Mycena epipterygia]|nr:hypothetical protein C8R44DRAFT_882892 [Mycena epipterygia]